MDEYQAKSNIAQLRGGLGQVASNPNWSVRLVKAENGFIIFIWGHDFMEKQYVAKDWSELIQVLQEKAPEGPKVNPDNI